MSGKEHSSTFFDDAPEWFLTLKGEAASLNSHHDIFEGILGISRIVQENPAEAFRLYLQLMQTISIYKAQAIQSETNSTQITKMIESGLYPENVCLWVLEIIK